MTGECWVAKTDTPGSPDAIPKLTHSIHAHTFSETFYPDSTLDAVARRSRFTLAQTRSLPPANIFWATDGDLGAQPAMG